MKHKNFSRTNVTAGLNAAPVLWRVVSLSLVVQIIVLFSVYARAHAADRALLIGISNYKNKKWQLEGPKYDVQAMWRLLRKRQFDDTRVLADSLPEDFRVTAGVDCDTNFNGRHCPTRSNIEAAFEELIEDVRNSRTDNFVYIHFSGHGSSRPEGANQRYKEPDNRDELFLALDRDGGDFIISDNQIGAWLEELRKAGARVWIVFDACNSGDLVRGAPLRARARGIEPSELNFAPLPQHRGGSNTRQIAPKGPIEAVSEDIDGLVAFYAAMPYEVIAEVELDPGEIHNYKYMGPLTYALHMALSAYPSASYSQLAHEISNTYLTLGYTEQPNFDGVSTTDRRAAFSGEIKSPAWRVKVEGDALVIAAGQLDNVHAGSVLMLFTASNIGDRNTPLPVCARVIVSNQAASVAKLVNCQNTSEPAYADPDQIAYAVMHSPGVGFVLKVARPPKSELTDQVNTILGQLSGSNAEKLDFSVEFVDSSSLDATVYLRVDSGRLWMFGQQTRWVRTGYRRSPSHILKSDNNNQAYWWLRRNLKNWSNSINLQRTASVLHRGETATRIQKNLKLKFHVEPDPTPVEQKLLGDSRRQCKWKKLQALPARAQPVDLHQTPELFHCDQIILTFTNSGNKPLDLTILYVGSDHKITALKDLAGPARIQPGETNDRLVAFPTGTWDDGKPLSVGIERAIVIAVEIQDEAAARVHQTFNHLAQAGVRTSVFPIIDKALRKMLDHFYNDAETRSLSKSEMLESVNPLFMQVIKWKITPLDPVG